MIKTEQEPKIMVGVLLPIPLYEKLEAICKTNNRSKAAQIRHWIACAELEK